MMGDLPQDIRQAWRAAVAPAHRMVTIVAVIALAIGIGANTAVFSVVDGLLLRPLPYDEPDELVVLTELEARENPLDNNVADAVAYANYQDWVRRNGTFDDIAAYRWDLLNLTGAEGPEAVIGVHADPSLWRVLGVDHGKAPIRMQAGRVFDSATGGVGSPVVVASDRIWRRRFAARTDLVGSAITINGLPHTVIGILPPEFEFPATVPANVNLTARTPDLFTPETRSDDLTVRTTQNHFSIGRLRDGVTLAQARADMDRVAAGLAAEYPEANGGRTIAVTRLEERVSGHLRPLLATLMGGMLVVLLVACLNVANLLLARGSVRARELGIRAALGASRRRLVRQLLVEGGLLAATGLALGIWLAKVGLVALLAAAPENIDRLDVVRLDLRVLAFAAAVAAISAIAFGLLPAMHLSRTAPGAVLGETARGGVGQARARSRRVLVVAEVALSLVLVATAGLLVRSYAAVRAVDPGFDPRGALSFVVMLSGDRYVADSAKRSFIRAAIAELERAPGVTRAAAINVPPLSGLGSNGTVTAEGVQRANPNDWPNAGVRRVSPAYFDVMAVEVRAGRRFGPEDDTSRPDVAILTENLAYELFGAADPIGRRVRFWGRTREVVGLVENVRENGLDLNPPFAVYAPVEQEPFLAGGFVVRTSVNPASRVEAVRRAVAAVDPDLATLSARSMEESLAASLARRRFTMTLLAAFAGMALVLAAVGLYGVLACLVTQRRREIGVRLALGASNARVLGGVMKDGLLLTGIGVAVGSAAATGIGFLVRGLLFGISPVDPVTIAAGPVILGLVALLATLLPARRAAAIEPIEALRTE